MNTAYKFLNMSTSEEEMSREGFSSDFKVPLSKGRKKYCFIWECPCRKYDFSQNILRILL
jgi:hypothetical protein